MGDMTNRPNIDGGLAGDDLQAMRAVARVEETKERRDCSFRGVGREQECLGSCTVVGENDEST